MIQSTCIAGLENRLSQWLPSKRFGPVHGAAPPQAAKAARAFPRDLPPTQQPNAASAEQADVMPPAPGEETLACPPDGMPAAPRSSPDRPPETKPCRTTPASPGALGHAGAQGAQFSTMEVTFLATAWTTGRKPCRRGAGTTPMYRAARNSAAPLARRFREAIPGITAGRTRHSDSRQP